jgi:hypothetical protein
VRSGGLIPIPLAIMEQYRKIILCVDVMKVNKMPFLVMMSRVIKFGTVAWLKNVKAPTLLEHIKEVRNIYIKRGFMVEIVEVDGQFEPLRGELAALGVTLNKCSREEHVPVAERRIQTLKERCRSICNTLPFTKLPGMLVVQMVSTCNFWLNVYPPKDGVSRNINPRELITGIKIDYSKHINAEFGEYVQVHEEHNNTMKTRTTGAIATKPNGNAQGGHWFYSLTTGRMLDRRRWTSLPMLSDVIDRINTLAQKCPVGMNFTNMRNAAAYDGYDDEEDYDSDNDSDDDSDYDSDNDESIDDYDYDTFIEGVNIPNADPPDPPDENVDENHHNNEEADERNDGDDEDHGGYIDAGVPDNEDEANDINEEAPVAPPTLRKLTDWNGTLPPILESRTRQRTPITNETLVTSTRKMCVAANMLAM